MWPFAKRGSRFLGDAATRSPSAMNGTDFNDNDAVIKLWLSERLLAAIDVLCAEYDASRPDVLRWVLFEHAYGRTEFAHLRRRARATLERGIDMNDICLSTRRAPSDEAPSLPTARAVDQHFLGKSNQDVKLTLPAALKRELEALAEQSGQPLSNYLRGVLTRQLLGEGHYQRWQNELERVDANHLRGFSPDPSGTTLP
jgi:hypothetical protein